MALEGEIRYIEEEETINSTLTISLAFVKLNRQRTQQNKNFVALEVVFYAKQSLRIQTHLNYQLSAV